MTSCNYDSYCGLYCGACSIMVAYNTGNKDEFASFWNDEMGLELRCHGCKTDSVFVGCTRCNWRKCARDKNVERCIDCSDFPCDFYQVTDKTSEILEKLPHLKTIRQNMVAIQSMGVAHWLAGQDKQWRCPECQTSFSWYATNCPQCGSNVENTRDFASVFDKSLLIT